jgi:hypothetical protein
MYQCLQRRTSPATPSAKQILPNPEDLPVEVFYQKQHHLMPHAVPVHKLITLEPYVRRDQSLETAQIKYERIDNTIGCMFWPGSDIQSAFCFWRGEM